MIRAGVYLVLLAASLHAQNHSVATRPRPAFEAGVGDLVRLDAIDDLPIGRGVVLGFGRVR